MLTLTQANVVSMPSWELFEEQEMAYKASVFPENIPVLSLVSFFVDCAHTKERG